MCFDLLSIQLLLFHHKSSCMIHIYLYIKLLVPIHSLNQWLVLRGVFWGSRRFIPLTTGYRDGAELLCSHSCRLSVTIASMDAAAGGTWANRFDHMEPLAMALLLPWLIFKTFCVLKQMKLPLNTTSRCIRREGSCKGPPFCLPSSLFSGAFCVWWARREARF